MALTRKDTVATVSIVVAAGIVLALMMGAFESVESRWAIGTFALFILAGVTGAITGTARMMRGAWSAIALYLLTIAAVTITLVNAFINSEAWFVAMGITLALAWLEFVAVDLFATDSGSDTMHKGTGIKLGS